MAGFFQSTTSKPKQALTIPKCGACGIFKTCISPKMLVTGRGGKGVLFVAEAPGYEEDRKNEQLVGTAGQELRRALQKIGIDLDRDCWKTNALICRPTDDEGESRSPTAKEVGYCRPNLWKTIKELQPRLIIPLGGFAVQSLLAPFWREKTGPINQWVGWKIPLQAFNSWVAPTFHPSFVLRKKEDREGAVVKLWFERYLEDAFKLEDRPWKEVPNFAEEIEIILDPEKAAFRIRDWIKRGGAFSFDYETNRLKPDFPGSEIVCCSVCVEGKTTIAYPWVGEAITATKELLQSPLPKMGANIKFETRWTRAILGVDVNNWVWDSMISSHHLDCRRAISSVKFQAFVRLGQEDWSQEIKPFLSSKNKTGENRIREVNLHDLLLYCGLDSLLEYKICSLQKKEMLG